ncbi:GNAT family N-acetyltransferase [Paenibacillus sp. HW567]|uniref:GNAT family N-acetyltransferase n=1 Tax=Paenibacillus sp. HW567 TaxID=1034769 RepID=UPI0003661A11|nr:GNAT family protein [Paenibacillus sp. HW567]
MTTYQGSNVYLRFFMPEDAAALLDLELRNRRVFEQFSAVERDDAFYTLEKQSGRIAGWEIAREEKRNYSFGIFLHENDMLTGDISLAHIVLDSQQKWILGYLLDQDHQGKGYMSEAVPLVLEYAFKEADIRQIEAGVKPTNAGSIKVLKKAGFQEQGLVHNLVKINGKFEEHVMFYINRSE